MNLKKLRKGNFSGAATESISVIVLLFVGIFMISMVSELISINNTSAFYSVYNSLVTSVSTIYSVNILLVVVALLAVALAAINSFRTVGGVGSGGSAV